MNLRKNNARLISENHVATTQVPEHDEVNVFGAALSRRNFVKAGGALFVGFGVLAADGVRNVAQAAPTRKGVSGVPVSVSARIAISPARPQPWM